ncbi:MAG: RDD family protein [Polyangiaceae bacterium]
MGPEENPFAPPSAEAELGGSDTSEYDDSYLRIASQGSRFVNLIVDGLLSQVVATVGGVVFGEAAIFVTIPLLIGYYLFFEGMFGKTPAKWLTNTRVVTVDGAHPRFMQILGRILSRYVPFEAFSFLDSHPVGWHDKWSGTRVIRDSR